MIASVGRVDTLPVGADREPQRAGARGNCERVFGVRVPSALTEYWSTVPWGCMESVTYTLGPSRVTATSNGFTPVGTVGGDFGLKVPSVPAVYWEITPLAPARLGSFTT